MNKWTIWHTCYGQVGEQVDNLAHMLWTGRCTVYTRTKLIAVFGKGRITGGKYDTPCAEYENEGNSRYATVSTVYCTYNTLTYTYTK